MPAPAAGGPKLPGSGRRGRWAVLGGALAVLAAIAFFLVHSPRAARSPAAPNLAAAPAPPLPPAERALRETVTRLPQDPDAHRGLGRYLLEQRRPFEALWHLRVAQALPPADPDTPVQAARALAQAGHPDRAVPLLRSRLAAAPTDMEARRALAETLLSTARVPEALAALASGGAALTTSASAQLLLGDCRAAAGDPAGARAAYRRAVALEPDAAAGHDRLGRLALAAGQWEAAKQECAAARERDPGEAAYGYRLGQAYWGAWQRAEAEQAWQEVAAAVPSSVPVQVALGKAAQSWKEWDAAAAHLVIAVRAAPTSREAQFALAEVMTAQGDRASAAYQRGLYYLETDRPHRALDEFRRMAALAPKRIDGPIMTALAEIRMKQLDVAAAEAQRALARFPGNSRLYAQLALLHVLGRNRPRATQLCQEWLKGEPNAAEPYRLLARIAREEQRLPDAQRMAEQALAREPQNPAVCSELAKDLDAIGGPRNRARALELVQQATTLNPRETDYWQQLGALLRAVGRPAEAADAYLRAVDLDPASVSSCTALVAIAGEERRPADARLYAELVTDLQSRSRTREPLWRALYRSPADTGSLERLIRSLLDAGELRRASYQLQELASVRPNDTRVRGDLARVERLLDLQ